MYLIRAVISGLVALSLLVHFIMFSIDLYSPDKTDVWFLMLFTIILFTKFSGDEFIKSQLKKIKRESDKMKTLKSFCKSCEVCHESTRIGERHSTDKKVICNDCRVKEFSSSKKVIGFIRE